MLSYKTIESNTLELLKRITALPVMSGMRLVGGTALALQYGHRKSVDLDFFGSLKLIRKRTQSVKQKWESVKDNIKKVIATCK